MVLTQEALYVKAEIGWKDMVLSMVERYGVKAGIGWKDMALSVVER